MIGQKKAMITCNKCDLGFLVLVLILVLVQVLVIDLVRGGEEEIKPMCVQQLPNNKQASADKL